MSDFLGFALAEEKVLKHVQNLNSAFAQNSSSVNSAQYSIACKTPECECTL